MSKQYKIQQASFFTFIYVLLFCLLSSFIVASFLLIYEPIHSGDRSSNLNQNTTVGDGFTISNYVDSSGKITFAVDKHYAMVEMLNNGNETTIRYYDEKGKPIRQPAGHYSLLYEYDADGKLIQTTYLDHNGNPCKNSGGYSLARYTYEKDKEYIRYYDIDGVRVTSPYEGAGRCNLLDAHRNIVKVIFLNSNDEPVIVQSGYAIIKRKYYNSGLDTGKVEFEFYYDTNEQPVALSHGEYGIHKEYDEYGRIKTITYLDSEANPIVTVEGYTKTTRTFYPDDTIKTESFLDLSGRPVTLSQGQSGILNENGVVWLRKENGSKIFNLNNYIYTYPLIIIAVCILIIMISSICNKSINVTLIIIYVAFILYMTVVSRDGHDARGETDLFWSYKQFFTSQFIRKEILLNIWAFVPMGSILYKLCPKIRILLVPIAIACSIESVQYFTRLGLPEVDDVFSNGFGGLIGFGLGCGLNRIVNHFSACFSHNVKYNEW